MTTMNAVADPGYAVHPTTVRESTLPQFLLRCGTLSSLLYVAMNIYFARQFEGYDSVTQTVSELSAIGAPTRSRWVVLGVVYTLLMIAFAWGVLVSARHNRRLRIVGGLLLAYGLVSLAWPLAPMHLRGTEFTFTDTMHIVLAVVTVLFMVLALGFGAAALGKRFRLYSIVSLLLLAAFGTLTGIDGAKIAANQPTPWVGVWERSNIGVFLLWVIVLASALLRANLPRPSLR
jgi:hypothetical protein